MDNKTELEIRSLKKTQKKHTHKSLDSQTGCYQVAVEKNHNHCCEKPFMQLSASKQITCIDRDWLVFLIIYFN